MRSPRRWHPDPLWQRGGAEPGKQRPARAAGTRSASGCGFRDWAGFAGQLSPTRSRSRTRSA